MNITFRFASTARLALLASICTISGQIALAQAADSVATIPMWGPTPIYATPSPTASMPTDEIPIEEVPSPSAVKRCACLCKNPAGENIPGDLGNLWLIEDATDSESCGRNFDERCSAPSGTGGRLVECRWGYVTVPRTIDAQDLATLLELSAAPNLSPMPAVSPIQGFPSR